MEQRVHRRRRSAGTCAERPQIVETPPKPAVERFADGHGPRQARTRSSQPLARLPAGDLTYLPAREAWLGQNGPSPSCYRRRRRSSQTPHCCTFFAAQTQGYRVTQSADGPRLFRFRVCPRRSKFLMRIRHQPSSAALARYCGRRFKVCLLHFTCVIVNYDRWCRGVPLLAVAHLLSV